MDNHWQRVVHCVSNSYAVRSKLEKHFICQKRNKRYFSPGYENRLTTWTRVVKVYNLLGELPSLRVLWKYAVFHRVWEYDSTVLVLVQWVIQCPSFLSFFYLQNKKLGPVHDLKILYRLGGNWISFSPTAPFKFWKIWHLWSKVMFRVSWKAWKHRDYLLWSKMFSRDMFSHQAFKQDLLAVKDPSIF